MFVMLFLRSVTVWMRLTMVVLRYVKSLCQSSIRGRLMTLSPRLLVCGGHLSQDFPDDVDGSAVSSEDTRLDEAILSEVNCTNLSVHQ